MTLVRFSEQIKQVHWFCSRRAVACLWLVMFRSVWECVFSTFSFPAKFSDCLIAPVYNVSFGRKHSAYKTGFDGCTEQYVDKKVWCQLFKSLRRRWNTMSPSNGNWLLLCGSDFWKDDSFHSVSPLIWYCRETDWVYLCSSIESTCGCGHYGSFLIHRLFRDYTLTLSWVLCRFSVHGTHVVFLVRIAFRVFFMSATSVPIRWKRKDPREGVLAVVESPFAGGGSLVCRKRQKSVFPVARLSNEILYCGYLPVHHRALVVLGWRRNWIYHRFGYTSVQV